MGQLGASLFHRGPTWRTEQSRVPGPRGLSAYFDDGVNGAIQRMFSVGPVKAMETVRPGSNQS